jgi:Serpin (serine protease inhibitor)
MKHSTVALAAGLVLAAGSINAQLPQAKLGPNAATVVNDSNTFALDLYGRLTQQDGNLFFSPYSISNALAMTYAGARGEAAAGHAPASIAMRPMNAGRCPNRQTDPRHQHDRADRHRAAAARGLQGVLIALVVGVLCRLGDAHGVCLVRRIAGELPGLPYNV